MDTDTSNFDIIVQFTNKLQAVVIDQNKIEKLIRTICNQFNLSHTTVNVAIVGDSEIRKLNNRFLNRSNTTDCLSFDLSDDNHKEKVFDLVVNGQRAGKEAYLRGHTTEAELALYITHGLLHNLGFDDSNEKDAKRMHETEDQILQQEGFGRVYENN